MIRLRPATADDARRIFEWANDPTTRAVSFSSEPIPWETHVAWFARKLADPACRLYVVCDDDEPVGQVRLDHEGARATISVAIAEPHRGRGLGVAAIRAALLESEAEAIDAFILDDNARSIAAFERAGFTLAERTTIAGRGAVRLELTRRSDSPGPAT